MRAIPSTAAVAASLALIGFVGACSSPQESPRSSEPIVENLAPPSDGGAYGTAASLRDAFLAAGGECSSWEKEDIGGFGEADKGVCGYLSFAIYPGEEERDEYVKYFRDAGDDVPNAILVGQNWVIFGADDEVRGIAPLLGGLLIDPEQD